MGVKLVVLPIILVSWYTMAFTQTNKNSGVPPALSSIKEADLKKDLYEMANDRFNGREAGTLDELKVSMWWADRLRAVGLKPAGDDGTYLQFFSLKRNRIAANSTIAIGTDSLQLWKDVLVAITTPARVSAPIVFVANGSTADLDKADVKGKAVAVQASPDGLNLDVSLWERRYPGLLLNKYRNDLIRRGAVRRKE